MNAMPHTILARHNNDRIGRLLNAGWTPERIRELQQDNDDEPDNSHRDDDCAMAAIWEGRR